MKPELERSLDWQELDAFIAGARGASFYHGSLWLRSLAEVYGYRLGFITLREGGRLMGLLPFAETKRFGLLHRQSLPFGTYGGPAVAPELGEEEGRALTDAFFAGLGGRVQRATLVEAPDPERPEPPASPDSRRLSTQFLDLSCGWEALFASRFQKERRRQIRKAQREGVVVTRSSDPAEVAEYYAIYRQHVSDWGLKWPAPLAHLTALVAAGEGVRFWVARYQGALIGGHLNFHFNGTVNAWNGTASKAHRHLAPSVLLYAVNLEQACAEKERYFNFGGSEGNDPLFEFKAAFGARPVHFNTHSRRGPLADWGGRLLAARSGRRP